jgi:hypothetical protein
MILEQFSVAKNPLVEGDSFLNNKFLENYLHKNRLSFFWLDRETLSVAWLTF